MSVKTTDHIVSDMLQREAFQAMAKLWKPLQKLRRLTVVAPLTKKTHADILAIIEEMEKILVPID